MKTLNVVNGPRNVSDIILGCMRMPTLSVSDAADIICTAAEKGINFYDHAPCYGDGEAETRFGNAFQTTGLNREGVILQSKYGLNLDHQEFDWSREDILDSVDGSLRRLQTDYLDVLLLNRPDLLYDPQEVANAFDKLEKSGKVRFFGVSNVTPGQLTLLKKYVRQPLIFNQLQFSLNQTQLIDNGLYMNNQTTERSIDRDNGILDYCRLHDITIQTWSPLQIGMFRGSFIDHSDFLELNLVLSILGDKYGVSKSAIAIAWILRHPAHMQAIVGTMNPQHLKDICGASNVRLTHHEWYELYMAAGKFLP